MSLFHWCLGCMASRFSTGAWAAWAAGACPPPDLARPAAQRPCGAGDSMHENPAAPHKGTGHSRAQARSGSCRGTGGPVHRPPTLPSVWSMPCSWLRDTLRTHDMPTSPRVSGHRCCGCIGRRWGATPVCLAHCWSRRCWRAWWRAARLQPPLGWPPRPACSTQSSRRRCGGGAGPHTGRRHTGLGLWLQRGTDSPSEHWAGQGCGLCALKCTGPRCMLLKRRAAGKTCGHARPWQLGIP